MGSDPDFSAAASSPLARRFWIAKTELFPLPGLGGGRFDNCLAGRAGTGTLFRNRAAKNRLAAEIAGGGGIAPGRAVVADRNLSGDSSPSCSRPSRRNSSFAACCFHSSSIWAGRNWRGFGVSFLFALIHGSAAIFIPLFALALALTWLYEKTGNLLAPIVVHGLFNAVNLVLLILAREFSLQLPAQP